MQKSMVKYQFLELQNVRTLELERMSVQRPVNRD